jgi:peptidyl-tRNA hydrolase
MISSLSVWRSLSQVYFLHFSGSRSSKPSSGRSCSGCDLPGNFLEIQEKWIEEGMPKIVLGVSHEETLLQFFDAAQRAHLPTYLVRDAGKTILPAGTITCLGIGPAPAIEVDALTGNLALLP